MLRGEAFYSWDGAEGTEGGCWGREAAEPPRVFRDRDTSARAGSAPGAHTLLGPAAPSTPAASSALLLLFAEQNQFRNSELTG